MACICRLGHAAVAAAAAAAAAVDVALGLSLAGSCNLLQLLFLFIFSFFFQPMVCLSEGLKIYAQARAADSYFFAFNKASSLQKFSPAFLGIFCWKFNLLQNVRCFLHIFQQNSWFTIFVSFSCSAVPHKSRILLGSFAVFRHWKSKMITWHETHCMVKRFSFLSYLINIIHFIIFLSIVKIGAFKKGLKNLSHEPKATLSIFILKLVQRYNYFLKFI